MPVFQIAVEADDGGVYRVWGEDAATSTTGYITSAVIYADGNIQWNWTIQPGQQTFQYRIKNNGGTVVASNTCSGINPTADSQITSNQPLLDRTDGPFTLEFEIYTQASCGGTPLPQATASGFDIPNTTGIEDVNKVLIGDQELTGTNAFDGRGWWRFLNVTIPQGANILSADIEFQAVSKGNVPNYHIRFEGEDTDNATTNPSSFADYVGRAKTSALTSLLTAWDPGVSYTFSLTAIVQEIVDRGGWASGNAMQIFLRKYEPGFGVDAEFADNDWISVQDFPSLSAATLTIEYGIVGVGSSDGTSTATATAIWGARGDAAGQSVADGFSAFVQGSTGTAAGSATTSGVGVTAVEGVGTSAGSATTSGVGEQGSESVGTSDGTSTATAQSSTGQSGVGTAAGTSTATADSLADNESVGSSDGSSTASGVGLSENEATGTSSGSATTAATGAPEAAGVGTSAGVANADNAEGLQGADAVGSSDGVATASGIAESDSAAVGTAAGSATALAIREVLVEAVGSSTGSATTQAGGSKAVFITGVAAGTSTAQARKLSDQRVWLQGLSERRGVSSAASDSMRFLELNGAIIIEPTAFEPDPTTHRDSHYYNAVTNTLYRKVITRSEPGIVVAHWQKVSD